MADLGAEVIKIEHPDGGDDTRAMGPPFIRNAATGEQADAAYFLACNRGKESVTVDLSTKAGQDTVREIALRSDVVVENFKVGALAKYGLDYAALSQLAPELIYCSITGFGQTGPYRERAGYDFLIQGMGGLMSVTGERDDRPGGGPQKTGVALVDILSGMYAAFAVVSALHHRQRGGGGQYIDIGMLDVQVAVLTNQAMNYLTTGDVPVRKGNGHPNIAPYQTFPARDGHVILAVGNNAQFFRMAAAMQCAALSDDPRFATVALRVENADVMIPIIEAVTRTRTIDEWVQIMEQAGVPCGPINTIDRVFGDPQVKARGMALSLPHSAAGQVPSVACPIQFSKTPVTYRQGPPVLGEHTHEVLRRIRGESR
jgi:crotonobetainyl-CoA:carnitine CoA-transferase CaiB-like acyl-CoA transferase